VSLSLNGAKEKQQLDNMTDTNQILEIWKDIIGYDGLYQVSNYGRVRSMDRVVLRNGKYPFLQKEKILKNLISKGEYYHVVLCKDGKVKTRRIHQLVAEAFLNHTPCGYELVVNHINFDKLDNRADNLEIISQRENTSVKLSKSTSKYTGVYWNKRNEKWMSRILINNKRIYLGSFLSESEAGNAYKKAI
jgi:hypothetical protein